MKKQFLKSNELYKRALKTIPQGSQTFSKSAKNFALGTSPLFIKKGSGARLIDVDDNEFIDYILALCPIILGYGDPDVDKAIRNQLDSGIIYSFASPLEADLSERLVSLIPCAEKVRFAKNGSDVTSAAIRLARAYTGKKRIAICGYHGWHDWFIGRTEKNLGVPEETINLSGTFLFNNTQSLETLLDANINEYAAVILEPEGAEAPNIEFLREVKRLANKHKALLVFDEIVTGFRMNIGGAQAEYDVVPDLACFGKSMANGMPISALVGRADVMDYMDHVFVSGTFGGELLSVAASIATIEKLCAKNVLSQTRSFGHRLKHGINKIFEKRGLAECLCVAGGDWRPVLKIKDTTFPSQLFLGLVRQELFQNGVIFGSGFNMCYSHCEAGQKIMDETLEAWDRTSLVLASALESGDIGGYIKGAPMKNTYQVR